MQDAAISETTLATDRTAGAKWQWLLDRPLLAVALYAALIYLPFMGDGRILTRHEVFITQPALQMLETGDWLVPRYAERIWIQKPPLVSWITAGLFAVFGFAEWAARLPAALSAIGLSVLMAGLARRYYGATTAVLVGCVQATGVYMYMHGRLGEVDMTFTLFIAAALVVLAWHWGRGEIKLPLRAAVLFHAAAGLAVMTKGPLALVLIGGTVLAFCLARWSLRPLKAVFWTPGVLAFFLVAAPWFVAVWMRLGPEALDAWVYDSLGRASGDHHLGAQSPFLYFYTIPWLVLPWTVVLVLEARRLVRYARQPEAVLDRFLWCWFLAGLALLTFSAFKHKHYCLPILPPLSIFAGRMLYEHLERVSPHARKLQAALFVSLVVVFGIVGGVVIPMQDSRQATVAFLRESVAQVPAEQPLYVAGLGQVTAYAYIDHRCVYLGGLPELKQAVQASDSGTIWLLTLQGNLPEAARHGLQLEAVATETPSRRVPQPEALVLGRLRLASDSGQLPAASGQ